MALTGQENFVPAAEEARPHRFLSLAPVMSDGYPSRPAFEAQAPAVASAPVETTTQTTSNTQTETAPVEATAATETGIPATPVESAHELKTRRSSSVTSDGSTKSTRTRFLRLGPVHYGVGLGDWSEDVLE